MGSYEITERGKITIAVILVAFLLIGPAAIILWLSSRPDAPPEEEHTPVISDTPHPTDSGDVNPGDTPAEEPAPTEDTHTPEPGPMPEPDPTPAPPGGDGDIGTGEGEPVFGPVGLDLAEGTMSFLFAPDAQEEVDDETVETISEFLSSPKNVRGARIKVEMPHISEQDEAAVISAVEQAFSRQGISKSALMFAMSAVTADERSFELALSFVAPVPPSSQK